MSVSIPIGPLQAQAARAGRSLEPAVLLEHGILGDPNDPNDATRRARGLVQQGRYHEAHELLTPHQNAPGPIQRIIRELLAVCGMHSGGTDWKSSLEAVLAMHMSVADALGSARVHRYFGDMLLAQGDLREADRHLRVAAALFVRHGEAAEAALCDCARAQLRLAAGMVDRALRRVEHALELLAELGQPRALALAQLERARVYAYQGEAGRAAKDLLLAERFLGVSGNRSDLIKVRIVRAETLVATGEGGRAASGLLRSLIDVVDLEDAATGAHVHQLLGEALAEQDPASARRHLSRSRHLYESFGFTYRIAACDIVLARVEASLGLNPRGRLSGLSLDSVREWPLLAARLELVRAEISAHEKPDQARIAFYKVRAFALDKGHRSLARQVDLLLVKKGLIRADDDDVTPIEPTSTGSRAVVLGVARAPEPFPIASLDDQDAWRGKNPVGASRLVRVEAPNRTAPSLAAPKSAALRRA